MKLTKRTIFNTVKDHLLAQNKRSHFGKDDEDSYPEFLPETCMYLSKTGLKCAVGCLINSAYYDPEFEGRNVSNKGVKLALERSGVNMEDAQIFILVFALQRVHDDLEPEHWAKRLDKLERKYFPIAQ